MFLTLVCMTERPTCIARPLDKACLSLAINSLGLFLRPRLLQEHSCLIKISNIPTSALPASVDVWWDDAQEDSEEGEQETKTHKARTNHSQLHWFESLQNMRWIEAVFQTFMIFSNLRTKCNIWYILVLQTISWSRKLHWMILNMFSCSPYRQAQRKWWPCQLI